MKDSNTNSMGNLPSKKAISIIVIILGIVISATIILKQSPAVQNIAYGNVSPGDKITLPEKTNWQKEVESFGTNPLVSGYKNDQTSSSSSETLTDSVSKTLISNYLGLKQSGGLNNTSAQKLIDQTVGFIDITGNERQKAPKITVVLENTTDSIKNYGNLIGDIFKQTASSKDRVDERVVIGQVIKENNQSDIEKLEKVIVLYQNISKNLESAPTPKIFLQTHTDMIVGLNTMVSGLKEIKTVFSDPLRGLSGLKQYQAGGNQFAKAMQATVLWMQKNNIDYKQGSGGYYLTKGI